MESERGAAQGGRILQSLFDEAIHATSQTSIYSPPSGEHPGGQRHISRSADLTNNHGQHAFPVPHSPGAARLTNMSSRTAHSQERISGYGALAPEPCALCRDGWHAVAFPKFCQTW